MRWPIRNQILLPFVVIQIVTVAGIALSSAWMAVRQVEDEITLRLANVLSTLETASYPLTPAVLEQLEKLSGAQFIVLDEQERLTASSMAATESVVSELAQQPWNALGSNIVESRSTLSLAGERYFAGRVQRRGSVETGTVLVLYPEKSWALARWQAMFPPLAIGGALLLLTVIASIWIAKRIGGRIQIVGRQVSRIAGGDFTPVRLTSVNDELRDLADGINGMAVALDDSMRRIRETERSALLTQLVGGLAHQLRNALTGARTSIQLHRRHCASGGDEAIDVALKQLTLTEEQIRALLRLTRGESRPSSPASVNTILDETISLVRPVCAHKKIEFVYERADVESQVFDADAMRAALLNLMMNAIEAAGPTGVVRVSARREVSDVVIEVADNGPGVSIEIAEDIFAPFFSTKDEGIGLGLALARKAAQDCNGTLSLHQSHDMTTFRLTLLEEAVHGAREPNSAEQVV